MEKKRKPEKKLGKFGDASRPMKKAMRLTDFQSVRTDPQGSWTGCPADPDEKPLQDTDDL